MERKINKSQCKLIDLGVGEIIVAPYQAMIKEELRDRIQMLEEYEMPYEIDYQDGNPVLKYDEKLLHYNSHCKYQ